MPSLFVTQGRDQGARFEFDRDHGSIGLGRDPSNRAQVHDNEVSRRHAELRLHGDTYTVVDLGSSNGTFVNGQRITEHELASGDQVQIGTTLMLFTGFSETPAQQLRGKVDIISAQRSDDRSRIVHTMRQEDGSQIFGSLSEVSHSPWLARARSNLQVMYRTALAVSHTLEIDQLLSRIMQLIFEWVEADRGCIMLVDQESRKLDPKVRRNRKGISSDEKIVISQTILDYVMERKEGVLTSDARDDQRWDPAASIVQAGIREAICVPMQGRYDIVGVIYIDTSVSPARALPNIGNKFTEEHLKLMVAIGHQAALAIEDTQYYGAMVQAERLAAVGQTIATLSHHIKNILQGIRGGSYLIEMGLADNGDQTLVRKGWDIVEKNQNKISSLVMDMLTFSKEREPELSPSDLNQVVSDVVELMQVRAEENQVELTWKPEASIPTLVFDSDGLHRAILNVVTNAIDASADRDSGGRVDVHTEYDVEQKQARVIVADNGCGIASEDMEKIFNLFVSRKGSRGTGLGLPVSQKILREHGGRIVVESEPGKGSRFILELPSNLQQESVGPRETGEFKLDVRD